MAICTGSGNYQGKLAIVEFVESCGDTDPTILTYLPIGSTNQKDVTVGTTTTDNTSDDTNGVQSSIVTFLTFAVTVGGFATTVDSINVNQDLLRNYLVNEVINTRQPTVFIRVILPDSTYYAFCNVTQTAVSASSTDTATANFEFTATATPFGSGIPSIQMVPTV